MLVDLLSDELSDYLRNALLGVVQGVKVKYLEFHVIRNILSSYF